VLAHHVERGAQRAIAARGLRLEAESDLQLVDGGLGITRQAQERLAQAQPALRVVGRQAGRLAVRVDRLRIGARGGETAGQGDADVAGAQGRQVQPPRGPARLDGIGAGRRREAEADGPALGRVRRDRREEEGRRQRRPLQKASLFTTYGIFFGSPS
jgi:hypothetical protein